MSSGLRGLLRGAAAAAAGALARAAAQPPAGAAAARALHAQGLPRAAGAAGAAPRGVGGGAGGAAARSGHLRAADASPFALAQRRAAATAAPLGPSPLQSPPPPLPVGAAARAAADLPTVQAVWRGVKMSPKKLSLVAALIRGLSLSEAQAQLSLLPKRGARVAEKVLASAAANAVHNAGLAEARLRVRLAVVSKGTYLKRIRFHARGKTGIMHHPKSHLTVVLEEVAEEAAARLSRRVARRVAPETPAWLRHRAKREARAARVAAGLGRRGGWGAAAPAAAAAAAVGRVA